MTIAPDLQPDASLPANDSEKPPKLLDLKFDGIPQALKENDRWGLFEAPWVEKRKKFDKIPIKPVCEWGNTDVKNLRTTIPDEWMTFDEASGGWLRDLGKGLGYLMTGPHGVIGYDLDGCVKDGVIEPWARDIADTLDSYTELSISGNGLHIFCRGQLSEDWTNHDIGIEVYAGNGARFLTISGHTIPGFPHDLAEPNNDVHEEIAQRYRKAKRVSVKAEISLMPELLEEVSIPPWLPHNVASFLERGEHNGDRSAVLFASGVSLQSAGLTKQETLSVLARNEFSMEVALDHRNQDSDRALFYLWKEHVLKASTRATPVVNINDFDIIPEPPGEANPLPPFKRDKNGAILNKPNNLRMAIERPNIIGVSIGYDNFRQEIMLHTGKEWRPFTDTDYFSIELALDRVGFTSVSPDSIRRAVHWVADRNQFDSAIEWLKSLKWDGIGRIESFLPTYLGSDETHYAATVSLYIWTALAARVLKPGSKADMVPVLVGDQGIRKSTTVAAIAPRAECYAEISFLDADKEIVRKMRGKMVLEIAELVGLTKRERNHVKSFLSAQSDEHRENYAEMSKKQQRRGLFIGTTNDQEFLDDPTGSRRFLPIIVKKGDVDSLKRDRDQLWAEAVFIFEKEGIWYEAAEAAARLQHNNFAVTEEWTEVIAKWMTESVTIYEIRGQKTAKVNCDKRYFTTPDIATDALKIPVDRMDKRTSNRIGVAMRQLGYTYSKDVRMDDGRKGGAWVKP